MGKMQTMKALWEHDRRGLLVACYNKMVHLGLTNILSDKQHLKLAYWVRFGKKLNLANPVTFNEKLQWLKLYDRNPVYTQMVDKYDAKQYVAEKIGWEYIIPTLGVWKNFEDIDFERLPNRFVLKCTHDSGSVVVCKDKFNFNLVKARKKLTRGLKNDAFFWGREWPYKNVEPQIIAEQYLEDVSGDLKDYKFMCFNGEVKCSFICSDRFSQKGLYVTFFDRDWNVMPFERHYPSVREGLPKPQQYNKMVELAEQLSQGIPFLRVDFYEVDEKIYFGELTFYPGSGFEEFTPESWDGILGSWIQLPES